MCSRAFQCHPSSAYAIKVALRRRRQEVRCAFGHLGEINGMMMIFGLRTCTPSIARSLDAAYGRAAWALPLGTFLPQFIMGQIKEPYASLGGDTSPGYTAGPWDHYDYQDPNYPTIKIEDDHGNTSGDSRRVAVQVCPLSSRSSSNNAVSVQPG